MNREVIARGVQMIPLDITLDGKRYGELFGFLELIEPASAANLRLASEHSGTTTLSVIDPCHGARSQTNVCSLSLRQ